MTEKLKLICVGAIAGAFGVKGEVRLKSFTSNPTDIANYAPLLTEGEDKSFDVVITRQLKNGLAVRLSGSVNKETAEQLKCTNLLVTCDRFPRLPDDELY